MSLEPETRFEPKLVEACWQAVLGSAQDAIVGIDSAGRIILFNRSAERMFGYRPEEAMGREVGLLMPAPYRHEHGAYIRSYEAGGPARAIGQVREVTGLRKNGEPFPLELSVSEARVDGEVVYVALLRDVTERVRTKAALRDSETTNRAIVDGAVDGIITIDVRGYIETVNPAAVRLFGYASEELIGRNVKILMPSPYREAHDSYIENYVRTGNKKIIGIGREVIGRHKNGTVFPIHLGVSEIILGERRLFAGVIHDISQRRRDEERIRELQSLAQQRERMADVGAITAKIVHDLGNPLGGLSLQAQRIARQIKRDPAQPLSSVADPVERIALIVRRLDELVHDFMAFAREQRLDLKPISMRNLLRDIVDEWEPVATARGIELVLELKACPELIEGDADKLRRVLDNLVKNAVEAIDRGPGRIGITSAIPSGEKVVIAIEDSGPGVAEGVQLFQLFETNKPEGSGFGLAIAKQIMLAHGGDVHHQSKDPHGAVFYVELPLAIPPADGG